MKIFAFAISLFKVTAFLSRTCVSMCTSHQSLASRHKIPQKYLCFKHRHLVILSHHTDSSEGPPSGYPTAAPCPVQNIQYILYIFLLHISQNPHWFSIGPYLKYTTSREKCGSVTSGEKDLFISSYCYRSEVTNLSRTQGYLKRIQLLEGYHFRTTKTN